MTYNYKFWQEMGWVALVAVLTQLFQALALFDPNSITDLRMWAVSIFAACIRAAFGAALAVLTRPR